MEDAFRLDDARFRASVEFAGLTDVSLNALARLRVEEITWEEVQLCLPPCSKLVANHWDWMGWLSSPTNRRRSPRPLQDEKFYFVYPGDNGVEFHPLGRFAAAILSSLEKPLSLADLVSKIGQTMISTGQGPVQVVAGQVRSQCIELYRSGLLDVRSS